MFKIEDRKEMHKETRTPQTEKTITKTQIMTKKCQKMTRDTKMTQVDQQIQK